MKRYVYPLIALIVLVLSGIGYLVYRRQQPADVITDRSARTTADASNASDENGSADVDSNGFIYDLDGAKLSIEGGDLFSVELQQSSVEDNATLWFESSSNPGVGGIIAVIRDDVVKQMVDKVQSSKNFDTYPQKFMAFLTSTQCTSLKPEDIRKVSLNDGRSAWAGSKIVHCTYNVPTPFDLHVNAVSFEENGYTVIVDMSGSKKGDVKSAEEFVIKVASAIHVQDN